MATDAICYRDAYAKTSDGTVLAVEVEADGAALVTLDRTVFYPGGGGQPADTGRLVPEAGAAWLVKGARKSGDAIVHELEVGPDGVAPRIGQRVTAELDWERRHLLMRTHTALHALCGIVWRDHGAQVTGGNMEPGKGRMDFEFETLDAALAASIERTVNAELTGRAAHPRALPAPRRGLCHPRPDPHQDQPAAGGHHRDQGHRHRGP